jgi:hypothetical protein
MQTWLLPRRKLAQAVFPKNDLTPSTHWHLTFLLQLAVLSSHAPHRGIKPAGFAMIVYSAGLMSHNLGLHPDTGVTSLLSFDCLFACAF